MPSPEPEELPRRYGRQELLARIYRDGERRRRRRVVGGLGACVSVVALITAAVLVARLPGGEPQEVATRGPASPTPTAPGSLPPITTTTSSSTPSTTSVAEVTTTRAVATTVPVTTTRPIGAPTTTEATTTTTAGNAAPACRDSHDPACGEFRWDPDPGPNAPLTIEVTPVPRAGDPRTVDFHVVYSDPDAEIDSCRLVHFGDDSTTHVSGGQPVCVALACMARYGPWTPPTKEPGFVEADVPHTFPQAGTYEVRFTARSGYGCAQPYGNSADRTITVVIP